MSNYTAEPSTQHPRLISEGPHFAQLWESVLFDAELSATAKVVYAVLTRYAARFGQDAVFPGQRTLAKELQCHQETVTIALAMLEKRGHIRRESRGENDTQRIILVAPKAVESTSWGPTGNSDQPRTENPVNPTGNSDHIRREENERESTPLSPPKTKRATQVPEDWYPPPALITWAVEKYGGGLGFDGIIEIETEKFILHHRSKGNTFKDVGLAWKKWFAQSREWASAKKASGGYISQADHNRGGTGRLVL